MKSPLSIAKVVSALVLVTMSAPRAARAQIHNVQSILAVEAEEGLSGTLTASADWRTGNIAYLFLSAAPVARYRAGNHLGIAAVQIDQKTSGDTTIISRFFEHLRYRYKISDRLLGEVFAQNTFDQVRRLEIRALVGAGPKFEILAGKGYGLGLGVAYMLEYEQIKDDTLADAGTTDLAHRASSYLTGYYEIDEQLRLVETLYYQPKLTHPRDGRMLNEAQLVVTVTKRLSFATSFSIAYDSRPPRTVQRVDTALTSSVTFEL